MKSRRKWKWSDFCIKFEVQKLVKCLQDYISKHFYQCTNTILNELGSLYASGGEFTENTDHAAERGTAASLLKQLKYTVDRDKKEGV